jgi:hypothetical protein
MDLRIHWDELIAIIYFDANKVPKISYWNIPKFNFSLHENFQHTMLLHCGLKKIHSIFSLDNFFKNTMLHHCILKKDPFNLEDKNKRPENTTLHSKQACSWSRTSSSTCLSHTLISLSVPRCFIFLVQEHNKSYISISKQMTSGDLHKIRVSDKNNLSGSILKSTLFTTHHRCTIWQIQNGNTSK